MDTWQKSTYFLPVNNKNFWPLVSKISLQSSLHNCPDIFGSVNFLFFFFLFLIILLHLRSVNLICFAQKKYEVCPESTHACTVKNRDTYQKRYKKHCTQDDDTSVPLKAGTLGPHTVLPITISCPVIFSCISLMAWNLFSFKGDFSFGKSQKSQGAKSGL